MTSDLGVPCRCSRPPQLDFRHILGYAMLVFVVYALIVSLAFGILAVA